MNPPDWPWERWREELRVWRRWVSPRALWQRTLHNPVPKTLALAVAVTLWFVATADRRVNVEQGFDVPITIRDTTGERRVGTRAVSELNPDTVQVTLSGRPDRLDELRPENIEALLDVTTVPEGRFSRPVTVTAPNGTVLRRVSPLRVQGFMDAGMVRTLPVTLGIVAPDSDALPRYQAQPAEVQVSGARRVVAEVDRVLTSPAALAPGQQRELPLLALDEAGEVVTGVQLRPATVTVRRLDTGTLPVRALPVVLGRPPAGLRVTSLSLVPSRVRLVGPPEVLADLSEVSGGVTYRVGNTTSEVRLDLPEGVQALDLVTATLTVEEREEPAAPARESGAP